MAPRLPGLGPASSVRALADIGLDPLVRLLQLLAAALQQRPDGAIGVARAASHAVVLAVCEWGGRLDPLWRVAIGHARDIGAEWALLFNGDSLRLVDTTRPFSRRFVQFDLEVDSG